MEQPYIEKILKMVEEGALDANEMLITALKYMGERQAREMFMDNFLANFLVDNEEEEQSCDCTKAFHKFNVYHNGNLIDSVHFRPHMTTEEVRAALIKNDGYAHNICVVREDNDMGVDPFHIG